MQAIILFVCPPGSVSKGMSSVLHQGIQQAQYKPSATNAQSWAFMFSSCAMAFQIGAVQKVFLFHTLGIFTLVMMVMANIPATELKNVKYKNEEGGGNQRHEIDIGICI